MSVVCLPTPMALPKLQSAQFPEVHSCLQNILQLVAFGQLTCRDWLPLALNPWPHKMNSRGLLFISQTYNSKSSTSKMPTQRTLNSIILIQTAHLDWTNVPYIIQSSIKEIPSYLQLVGPRGSSSSNFPSSATLSLPSLSRLPHL